MIEESAETRQRRKQIKGLRCAAAGAFIAILLEAFYLFRLIFIGPAESSVTAAVISLLATSVFGFSFLSRASKLAALLPQEPNPNRSTEEAARKPETESGDPY